LAGVGLLVVCGGIGVALLLPAVQAARQAALKAQARTGAVPSAPVGPAWAPNPLIDGKLTNNVSFDRYSVRLPMGFTPAPAPPAPAPPGVKMQTWMWAGQDQPNGARSAFIALVAEVNDPLRLSLGSLETALAAETTSMRVEPSISAFRDQPAERGQLSGKQFIRARYSASMQGVPMHGVILLTIEGNRKVVLISMCTDTPGTAAYNLLDAGLLTFRQN
jgi:hypothetical protein